MRNLLFLLLLVIPFTAAADSESCARFGRNLVCLGDNEAKVWDRAGKPDITKTLVNGYGAAIGEQWVYYMDTRPKKVVTIDIQGGAVTYIGEKR